jgi:hypothetical protein
MMRFNTLRRPTATVWGWRAHGHHHSVN